jgi:hypothetical protein
MNLTGLLLTLGLLVLFILVVAITAQKDIDKKKDDQE